MSDDESERRDYDARVEREARMGRTPSLADLIGREGGGYMRGESAVSKLQRDMNAARVFVRGHVEDLTGALVATLETIIDSEETRFGEHEGQPLAALAEWLDATLAREHRFAEFVRQVDVRWGEMMDERPRFERPGQPPADDDEYTLASVRRDLEGLRAALDAALSER